MPWDIAWPAHTQPPLEEISRRVDSPLFDALQTWMADTYQASPSIEFSRCSMDRGWNVKYKKGSKALCALYIRSGYFTAMVTFGAKQTAELEVLLPTFSPALQTLYQKTPFCNGGKWLCVDVKDQALLEDVQRLILLKAKPVQKRSGKTED